jgi:hypothetical protein
VLVQSAFRVLNNKPSKASFKLCLGLRVPHLVLYFGVWVKTCALRVHSFELLLLGNVDLVDGVLLSYHFLVRLRHFLFYLNELPHFLAARQLTWLAKSVASVFDDIQRQGTACELIKDV